MAVWAVLAVRAVVSVFAVLVVWAETSPVSFKHLASSIVCNMNALQLLLSISISCRTLKSDKSY